jgi:predicted MFS family arabinose efflux permease
LNALWALAIAVFAVGVDTYITAGIVPELADDLREPVAAVGLIASAYALPTALLAPLFGPFSDRRGRRTAMLTGLGIFVASAAACTVAPTLPVLLLARATNGLGAAIIVPAVFAYAGDIADATRRDRAMGLLASSIPLATLLGLPFGSLVASIAGWRGAFVFVTLVGLVALAAVRSFCPPDVARSGTPLGYRDSYRGILGDRSARSLLAVTLVWFIGPTGLFVYVSEFFHVVHGVPTTQAGLSLAMVGLAGVIASRLSGRFMEALGPRNAVLSAVSIVAVAMLAMPLTTGSLVLSLLVLGLWASGTWFGVPAMQAIVAAHTDRLRGTMLAFNSSAFNLASVLGPVVMGAVITAAGFGPAFLLGAASMAVALALAWAVLPHRTADPAAVTPASRSMSA